MSRRPGPRGGRGGNGTPGAPATAYTTAQFTQPAIAGSVSIPYEGCELGVGAEIVITLFGTLVGRYRVDSNAGSIMGLTLLRAEDGFPPGTDIGDGCFAAYGGTAGPSFGELVFMAGNVGTNTTTLYMVPGYIGTASPDFKDFKVSRAMTVVGMLYKARTGHVSPSIEQIFFSLRRDGNPESLALLIDAGATTGDTTGQDGVTFAAGSTIGVQVDKANAGITTSPADAAVTLIVTYP